MKLMKHLVLLLCVAGLFAISWTACGPTTPVSEANKEVAPTDGGTNKETGGADEAPAGPIEITFDPASGEIDVKDPCIKVKMSSAPGKLVKAEFMAEGASTPTASSFSYDTKGDPSKKTALACPYSLLEQGIKYTLSVEVLAKGKDPKTYKGSAEYTTKKTFADKEPPAAGLAVNLQILKILTPELLGSLLEGQKDQIPPILLTLHKRDEGKKGNLLLIGGLGKAPAGGKAHEGKDVVNTETPVSLSLVGRFEGRWFAVGPTTFILAVAGISIRLENFHLTGIFSEDGKNIDEARLTAVIDPEVVKKQFQMDICAIVECATGADGQKRVRIAGTLKGIPNPIEYSAFITKPLYLENDVDPALKMEFYTTADTKKEDVTVKVSSCKGSQKEDKPCSEKDGAKIEAVAGDSTVTIDDSKKKGEITLPKLEAATWYKVDLETKSADGKVFKTFVQFKTK